MSGGANGATTPRVEHRPLRNRGGDHRGIRRIRDNMVLETAIRGKAHYLVPRDDDLKRDQELIAQMQTYGVQIITVQQFLDILNAPNG